MVIGEVLQSLGAQYFENEVTAYWSLRCAGFGGILADDMGPKTL